MADHMQKTGEKLLRRSIGGLGEHMVHMGTGPQKCCSQSGSQLLTHGTTEGSSAQVGPCWFTAFSTAS